MTQGCEETVEEEWTSRVPVEGGLGKGTGAGLTRNFVVRAGSFPEFKGETSAVAGN